MSTVTSTLADRRIHLNGTIAAADFGGGLGRQIGVIARDPTNRYQSFCLGAPGREAQGVVIDSSLQIDHLADSADAFVATRANSAFLSFYHGWCERQGRQYDPYVALNFLDQCTRCNYVVSDESREEMEMVAEMVEASMGQVVDWLTAQFAYNNR